MSTILLKGAFQDSTGLGVTGLTVTIDLYRLALADLTSSQLLTDAAATEIGGGLYAYRYASADCSLYEYVSVFKTSASEVSSKHSFGQHFVMPDELVGTRATQASVDNVSGSIVTIKTQTDKIPDTVDAMVLP